MEFIHYSHRNRIMDFIYLPSLLTIDYEDMDMTAKEKEVCADVLADMVHIKHFLEPFTDRITKYFRGNEGTLYIDFLYRYLLEKGYDPKDMEELYQLLLQLTEEELSETYLSFLTDGNKTSISDHEIFDLIEERVPIESRRWAVFWNYHHLTETIEGMIAFYKEALPLYLPFYEHYADEVEEFKQTLDMEALYNDANFNVMGFLQSNQQTTCLVFIRSPLHLANILITDDKDSSRPAYAVIYPRIEVFIASRVTINKDSVGSLLKVLSDPVRYDILKLLYQDVQKHKDIAERLGTTAANVSFHISKIIDVGLFNLPDYSEKKYKLNKKLLKECLDFIAHDFDL